MLYRPLGKTGLKVAEVGIGTWQLADDPNCWVGADPKESLASLHRYTELGGNFIDTAWVYGHDEKDGHHRSHELIGKFLKESRIRNQLIIASKIAPKNMNWPALPGVPVSHVFPDDWIIKSVDQSLKDLGTDYLDLMQFHVWHDDFVNRDGWKNTIQKITSSGKVRFWGISINNYQPENCLRTLDTGLISAIQFIFNIFHQQPTEKLLPYAQKHHIGLIARVPLDEGGLSGKFTTLTRFADGDFRRHYFSPDRLKLLVSHTDKLKKILGTEAQTLPELALRYILSHQAVSTVIPGMRKVSYVDANTSVSDGRNLSPSLIEKLKSCSWERDFYAGSF
jgi:aryl-alcohol dehydrogenase-like predicted oxidoreductase